MKSYTIARPERIAMYPVLVISLVAIFAFYKYVLQVFPSVITQQLMTSFHLSGVGLGNLAATFYYAYLIMQIFVGIIIDKFNLRWVITNAILTCALGVLLFAFAKNNFQACVARSLMGLGVAFAPIAYMKIAAVWVPKSYYGFVNGLMATCCMLGAIFSERLFSNFTHDFGWRTSLILIAIFGVLLSVAAMALIKNAKQETHHPVNHHALHQLLRNKQNWWLCLYGGFAFSPLAIFAGLWGNIYLQQAYRLTPVDASSQISLIFIGLAVGSPVLGMISDWLGNRKKIIVSGTMLAFLSLLSILYGHHFSCDILSLSLFTFGFSLGAYMLTFTIGKEINSIAFTATVAALINSSEAILDSITEPLIGKLLDLSWDGKIVAGSHYFSVHSYENALMILPCYLIVAMLTLFMIKNR